MWHWCPIQTVEGGPRGYSGGPVRARTRLKRYTCRDGAGRSARRVRSVGTLRGNAKQPYK